MDKKIRTVEEMISEIRNAFPEDKKIGDLFENCFSNTLNKTVKKLEDGTTFVITGDIPAMWLRDSVCQLRPYLVLAGQNEEIAETMEGLIKRQMDFISKDPYANAFNESANGAGHQEDRTQMQPFIWERKYEIDSLCFPVQFSYLFWKNTGRSSIFTAEWKASAEKILDVFETEQNHEEKSEYLFERTDCVYTDTLSRGGKGALVKSNIGLIWSGFRPSDDACVYGYLIPSNMFAVVILNYIKEIAQEIYQDEVLAERAGKMAEQVRQAIETYGVLNHPAYGEVYAYEVDGFGQYNLMDDANVPSLLAMSYLGYCDSDSERCRNTRNMILSETNPYYYKGTKLSGIGSPHTPVRHVWHIALSMQGLTEKDADKKREMIELLKNTDGDTGMMHEGVFADDPKIYTREWFSWSNAMFCELVMAYCGYIVKR